MSDFWIIYKDGIRERFQLENTLANSDAHRDLIDFEILVGNDLLRTRKIKVENLIPDAKDNEREVKEQHFCQKCNEEFKIKLTHMIEKHRNDCPYCPVTFTDIWNLRRHIKNQHQTLYNDYLTAVQKMRAELQAEENTKKGYMHTCKICPKKFRSASDVQKHEVTHNNEKLFSCKICKKRFAISYYLVRHTKEVHGSTKHNCKICKKSYNRSSDVIRHQREVHESKTYNCKFCSFQTPRLYKLRMHEQNMHVNLTN